MKYLSTAGQTAPQTFDECLLQGLAPDGGLFVPEKFPAFDLNDGVLQQLAVSSDLATFATELLKPFVTESKIAAKLAQICAGAFDFETPLKVSAASPSTAVLELYHGPTAAFKDVGARFLAECLVVLGKSATVLVATSGDTGGAVAAAFNLKKGMRVVILYPKGMISKRQEKQLTCWGDPVKAFAVQGTFDDCQRVVKAALSDRSLATKHQLISANSISVGRLLPQMAYHARASLQYFARFGKKPTIVVPTGNLGNAVAAMWAKHVGLPIDKIILATNENSTIPDYFSNGIFAPGKTVSTLANAMDISNPSNFARMRDLYPDLHFLKDDVASISVTDVEIRAAITSSEKDYGQVFCPHTAVAAVAKDKLQIENAILVATAHPAKFESIVEPLIGREIPIPDSLLNVLSRPSASLEILPTLDALRSLL